MSPDWSFCTLALGNGYRKLARQLAEDLARLAPDARLLILSDAPSEFKDLANVTAVYHRQQSVLGYHDKLPVVRRALRRYRTAVFIDADSRILAPVDLDPARFSRPAVRALRMWSWPKFYDWYGSAPALAWQKENLRMMGLLKSEYHMAGESDSISYLAEGLFSVTRGSASETEAFFKCWNDIAEFCERSRFFRHEGFAIGLAAKLTDFPIEQYDFNGIYFFEPVFCLKEVASGRMAAEVYDGWNATIAPYKYPKQRIGRILATWRRARKYVRYLKIRMFGLNLLRD